MLALICLSCNLAHLPFVPLPTCLLRPCLLAPCLPLPTCTGPCLSAYIPAALSVSSYSTPNACASRQPAVDCCCGILLYSNVLCGDLSRNCIVLAVYITLCNYIYIDYITQSVHVCFLGTLYDEQGQSTHHIYIYIYIYMNFSLPYVVHSTSCALTEHSKHSLPVQLPVKFICGITCAATVCNLWFFYGFQVWSCPCYSSLALFGYVCNVAQQDFNQADLWHAETCRW